MSTSSLVPAAAPTARAAELTAPHAPPAHAEPHRLPPATMRPSRMSAWVVRPPFGIDALAREERPVPSPGPTQLLVRVGAVSLNYRDLQVVRGAWRPTGPRVPASDGAGLVVAVGAAVTRHAVGDRVAGTFFPHWADGEPTAEAVRGAPGGTSADGMLAEYVLLDQEAAVAVPAHLSDVEAATLPCAALTAWHAVVERGAVRAGDTVLVQGTGGVSLFALQFARLLGARVLATSSTDEKLRRLRALGAEVAIDRRATPDWEHAVVEHTDGRGVDHVVDVAGGAELDRSLRAARVGGTVSLVGMLAGERAPVSTFLLAEKRLRLHGILVGSRAMFERMNAAVSAHRLQPIVDRVFPAAAVADAFHHLAGAAHCGKVCVALRGDDET